MSLQIHYECPQCNRNLPLDLHEFAPGRRQICESCQTPGRMTEAGLENFSRDLLRFCQVDFSTAS